MSPLGLAYSQRVIFNRTAWIQSALSGGIKRPVCLWYNSSYSEAFQRTITFQAVWFVLLIVLSTTLVSLWYSGDSMPSIAHLKLSLTSFFFYFSLESSKSVSPCFWQADCSDSHWIHWHVTYRNLSKSYWCLIEFEESGMYNVSKRHDLSVTMDILEHWRQSGAAKVVLTFTLILQ